MVDCAVARYLHVPPSFTDKDEVSGLAGLVNPMIIHRNVGQRHLVLGRSSQPERFVQRRLAFCRIEEGRRLYPTIAVRLHKAGDHHFHPEIIVEHHVPVRARIDLHGLDSEGAARLRERNLVPGLMPHIVHLVERHAAAAAIFLGLRPNQMRFRIGFAIEPQIGNLGYLQDAGACVAARLLAHLHGHIHLVFFGGIRPLGHPAVYHAGARFLALIGIHRNIHGKITGASRFAPAFPFFSHPGPVILVQTSVNLGALSASLCRICKFIRFNFHRRHRSRFPFENRDRQVQKIYIHIDNQIVSAVVTQLGRSRCIHIIVLDLRLETAPDLIVEIEFHLNGLSFLPVPCRRKDGAVFHCLVKEALLGVMKLEGDQAARRGSEEVLLVHLHLRTYIIGIDGNAVLRQPYRTHPPEAKDQIGFHLYDERFIVHNVFKRSKLPLGGIFEMLRQVRIKRIVQIVN